MVKAGLPREEIEKTRERIGIFRELGDALEDVSIMENGQEFIGDGYELKVVHTPGHTPGSCCLYEARQKVLFSGDHIIKHITPNLLIVTKRDRLRNDGYRSLWSFIHSLDKVMAFDVRFVHPGHGECIEDLAGVISGYKTHHRQRLEQMWQALCKREMTLYDLIDEVFPHVPEGETFLAMSEIAVHLEILISEGEVALIHPGPPALYKAVQDDNPKSKSQPIAGGNFQTPSSSM